MDRLDNPVHRDAWGSTTAIPRLLGVDPDGGPCSELWMGAHPAAPSRVERAGVTQSLAEVIRADPETELGAAVTGAYGPRLPFLLKVLAAARPLSLQAHPSRSQAAAGFADEERRGVAPDDPGRNYADADHKPEMLCALTEFHALCGFRAVAETIDLLETLTVPDLDPDLQALRSGPDGSGVRRVLDRLLHLPDIERTSLVQAVSNRCAELVAADGAHAREAQTVLDLADQHPGDAAVVCALLMNQVTLQPGEAIFLAAGNLHAYLRGVGVEVMASSDNVVRAGLTERHVDVDELLAIVDTTPGPVPLVTAVAASDVEVRYPAPVADFRLSRLTLPAGRTYELAPGRPRILLVVDGRLEVAQDGRTTQLARGQSGFLRAGDPPAVLTGAATAFLVTTSLPVPGDPGATGAAG